MWTHAREGGIRARVDVLGWARWALQHGDSFGRHRGVGGIEPGERDVVLAVDVLLLEKGEHLRDPSQLARRRIQERQPAIGVFVVVASQRHLFEIVLAAQLRAASRAACTAGNNIAVRTPMIVMTTSSSTNVKCTRGRSLRPAVP